MKMAWGHSMLCGFVLLTGCEGPRSDALDAKTQRPSQPVRIEFVRAARVFEDGDAMFMMVNDTRQVLWFDGKDPDSPAYRLRAGAAAGGRSAAAPTNASAGSERIPLSPGQARYFEVQTGNTSGVLSVGVTFYPSRTGTNGTTVWSSPATLAPKTRTLNTPG